LAEDHAIGRFERPADHSEAGGQAGVPRHFPADRGTWIMKHGPAAQRLDLGIVTWVP